MGRSNQQLLDDASTTYGNLIPLYLSDDLGPGTDRIATYTLADGQKILEGYACGNSRCATDYGGMYRVVCPVCLFDRRVDTPDKFMVDVPQYIIDYHLAREAALADPDPKPKRLPSMEQAILGLADDPDVENVTLKRLGPSKWGRGGKK
jgi:hypothetical protein